MKRFIEYITEAVSSNTKGVLHELLVGKHLNGGKHMEKHKDINGDSPEEAHDKLKASISDDEYNQINNRAKAAAEDIRKKVGTHGNIHQIHWTSKEGDIHRATGIHSTQKQDASDIVVTTKNKDGKIKHHGISLKVTDKKKGNVPVSNPGMEATHGGQVILDAHRASVLKSHPALKGLNKEGRKNYIKDNPKAAADIKNKNRQTLTNIVDHLHSKLESMPSHELAQHIRSNVLHANSTPMQEQGHEHIKHTTNGTSNYSFQHGDPSKDYEHILNDHNNITVHNRGTSVIFKHKGKPFAKHRLKFESQSDPLSSVKGSGELM